jgi:hypothetical protein
VSAPQPPPVRQTNGSSHTSVNLDALAERVAHRVAELLLPAVLEALRAPAPSASVDAATLAGTLGVSRAFVYEHAAELGARRTGPSGADPETGKLRRPRLRFDVETARAAFLCPLATTPRRPIRRWPWAIGLRYDPGDLADRPPVCQSWGRSWPRRPWGGGARREPAERRSGQAGAPAGELAPGPGEPRARRGRVDPRRRPAPDPWPALPPTESGRDGSRARPGHRRPRGARACARRARRRACVAARDGVGRRHREAAGHPLRAVAGAARRRPTSAAVGVRRTTRSARRTSAIRRRSSVSR